MSQILRPFKEVLNPEAVTKEKQQEILSKEDAAQKTPNKQPSTGVIDPVTGDHLVVKNATQQPEEIPHGENVLKMAFPPPDLKAQANYLAFMFQRTLIRIVIAFTVFPIALFWVAPARLEGQPMALLFASLVVPFMLSAYSWIRLQNHSIENADRHAWQVERERGLLAGYDEDQSGKVESDEKIKESAEWLNALLRGIWPIINPTIFTSAVDMIEDIMQAAVPKFIQSVRISDLSQGENPIRITSLRALPDAELDEVTKHLQGEEREQIEGDHVNLELSFAYRALPKGENWALKAQNAHLLVEFYVGISGLAAVSVPVWAEITGIVGTARLRLELIPDPPFIKHTLITLTGLPNVSLSITPLHKKLLPNVMDLPFLSKFISDAINTAASGYVAPKSLMLDIQQLLGGDGINRDTEHIGVVVVHIHRAKVIKNTEQVTKEVDAYVNICLSPMNKAQYSTRIIMGSAEPVFEETAILLVDANAVKVGERVSLQLWDSDKFTADDMVGHVEVAVAELIQNHNTPVRRKASLKRPISGQPSGELEYTVGFFAKLAPGSVDSNQIPRSITESDAFKKVRKDVLTDMEAAVAVSPPSDEYFSGILGIQLHEIRELGVKQDNMAVRKDVGAEGDDKKDVEEGSKLPSAYCTILINDEAVYRTRTKPMTTTPFFNASTEKFIRDWKAAHICVVVRDARMREKDPIMGLLSFKLSDLFKESSVATGTWSLQHGIGYGKIRISMVFRSLQLSLPPPLTGFDTGTLQIDHVVPSFDTPVNDPLDIRLHTSGGYHKIRGDSGSSDDDETSSKESILLPVQKRYHSCLLIDIRKKGMVHHSTMAMGVIWLRDLVDHKGDELVETTLWETGNYEDLKQNYTKPDRNSIRQSHKPVGHVTVRVRFLPGISDSHEKEMKETEEKQRSWEEYSALKRAGLRERIGRDDKLPLKASNCTTDEVEPEAVSPSSSLNSKGGKSNKIKAWRDHQDDLTTEHRGIKQYKPVRTAEWVVDGARGGVQHFVNRFRKRERTEAIEKEA